VVDPANRVRIEPLALQGYAITARPKERALDLRKVLEFRLPPPCALISHDVVTVMGVAPSRWFILGTTLPERSALQEACGDRALVSAIESVWQYYALRGAAAPEVLASLVAIDLAPDAFGSTACAITAAGPYDLLVWRLRGEEAGFGIGVARSLSRDFHVWLEEAVHFRSDRGGRRGGR
jgi:heterotetrameric sarcosine oxidase gamma subunit